MFKIFQHCFLCFLNKFHLKKCVGMEAHTELNVRGIKALDVPATIHCRILIIWVEIKHNGLIKSVQNHKKHFSQIANLTLILSGMQEFYQIIMSTYNAAREKNSFSVLQFCKPDLMVTYLTFEILFQGLRMLPAISLKKNRVTRVEHLSNPISS